MADSLILDGLGELMRGSQSPELPYCLSADGNDFGAPVPATVATPMLLGDGSVTSGRRSEDRQMTLELIVDGDSETRGQVVSRLAAIVDDQAGDGFTLTFTPDGGKTVVFDCKRGSVDERFAVTGEDDGGHLSIVTLSFPAAPFTRTVQPIILTSASSQVTVDTCEATTGFTANTGATLATSTDRTQGTKSIENTTTFPAGVGSGTLWTSHTVSLNLTGLNVLQVDLKHAASSVPLRNDGGPETLLLKLTDGSGNWSEFYLFNAYGQSNPPVLDDYRTFTAYLSALNGPDGWPALHAHSGTLNLATIASWKVSWAVSTPDLSGVTVKLRVDNLIARTYAYGGSGTYRFSGVPGGYRTPVKLDVHSSADGDMVIHQCPRPLPGYDPLTVASSGMPVSAWQGPHLIVADVTVTDPGGSTPLTLTATATQDSVTQSDSRTWSHAAMTANKFGVSGVLTHALVVVGVLHLPVLPSPPENTGETFGIAVAATGWTTTVHKVMAFSIADAVTLFTHTAGQGAYIDPTTPNGTAGQVYVGATRSAATGKIVRGAGTIHFAPGDNVLTGYVAGSAVTITSMVAEFYPRFLLARPRVSTDL